MNKVRFISLLLIIGSSSFLFYIAYQFYSPPQLECPYHTHFQDDTIRIAYIGDSWAHLHKYHNCQIPCIIERQLHRPVMVHTNGVSGLTSKGLYELIYTDGSLKSFFQKRGCTFAVIIVGVNDTDMKMSVKYYQRSMEGIIQFLLANNIFPIILEIPDYNIRNALKMQGRMRTVARTIAMVINDTPLDCKELFRIALDDMLNESGYRHQVGVVRYKSWNNDYMRDLDDLYLDDGVHLNARGYEKLDSVIAEQIVKEYNSRLSD